ncbi:flagellar brake protein [Geodermatophilus poikilotrophus]|uniref:PilZ domain-containing protein n=1 Tax=Geodermatophilus poikilotrophus TaxID=1333667 RepID=A0A1I0GP34_9ACTN|nr:PilZ domain-containing protein [Geodermatophilus poikilotrophus]SET73039.1 PilZ domain-containing protein [Geodermatophilus poikilotrophus]
MNTPGVDHPHRDGEVEVVLPGHRVSVNARVEAADAATVVVRPSVGEFAGQVVRIGEEVQLVWHDAPDVRMVTAEVATVQHGAVPRWHLDVTAPAEPVQRREAVRGRFAVRLTVTVDGVDLAGDVLDLSEAGTRAVVDAYGAPPSPGAAVAVVLELEDGALTTSAEVVWYQVRGRRWTLSLRFTDLPEKDQDRLRRRVFQAMREERARAAT